MNRPQTLGVLPKNNSDTELLNHSLEVNVLEKLQNGTAAASTIKPVTDRVNLPRRYNEILADDQTATANTDLPARKDDLSTAISWLRQELLMLKRQDQHLIHQFAFVGSAIKDIKENPAWTNDPLGMSCQSLDFLSTSNEWSPDSEIYITPPSSSPTTPVNDRDILADFRTHIKKESNIRRTQSVWVKRTNKEQYV
ncbi:uncharacterized protein LOC141900081 [Tubulanus polymorphus]|uniref:uncharacterized protein LOC141900081 n=1 Tax=Tubulanus polymorphus TaxID=672921 RepID=UPI003DA5DBDA